MSAAYAQGLKLSSQGRHADAIAQFEQALTQDPDDPKVLFALGNTASQLGLAGFHGSLARDSIAGAGRSRRDF